MIVLSSKLGATSVTGPSFSIISSQVDEIEIMISNLNSLTSQLVHITMENDTEQFVNFGTMSEDTATALTLSIILQADDPEDVSADLNQYMGIKSITVELLT